jgi:hypothetical protein
MTPESILFAPVLLLITVIFTLLVFFEEPWSNITSAIRVRVEDNPRRRSFRSVEREQEEAAKVREQDRNILLISLLTIFTILFMYLIS